MKTFLQVSVLSVCVFSVSAADAGWFGFGKKSNDERPADEPIMVLPEVREASRPAAPVTPSRSAPAVEAAPETVAPEPTVEAPATYTEAVETESYTSGYTENYVAPETETVAASESELPDTEPKTCDSGATPDCNPDALVDGRVRHVNTMPSTTAWSWLSDNTTPENSEMLLPNQTFTLWVSDEVAELIQTNPDAVNAILNGEGAAQALQFRNVGRSSSNAPLQKLTRNGDKVNFESGLHALETEFRVKLDDIAKQLGNKSVTRMKVVGHADTDRLSANARSIYGTNQGLSQARAEVVAKYLLSQVEIPPHALLIEGRSDREPIASNDNEAGKRKNRRVDVHVWYQQDVVETVVPDSVAAAPAARPEPIKRIQVCRKTLACYQPVRYEDKDRIQVRGVMPPVRFISGRADITPEYVEELRRELEAFKDKSNVVLRFIGHTDNERLSVFAKPIFTDNMGLSFARAREVAAFVQRSLNLPTYSINIDGRGEFEPVASNNTRRGMALNRRVEVEVWYDPEPAGQKPKLARCGAEGEGIPVGKPFYKEESGGGISDPFAMSDFRISVDGQALDNGPVHTADVQRCTDVALEKSEIQVQYDSLTSSRRLNVSAWPLTASTVDSTQTPWKDNLITFQGYSNYSAFFSWAEVRLFSQDQSVKEAPSYVVNLNEDLRGEWLVDESTLSRLGGKGKYVIRVYDGNNHFDETKPQPIWIDNDVIHSQSRVDTYGDINQELLVGYGESRVAVKNIPVNGGTITVNGINVPKDHRVWAMDQQVPVSSNGSFVTQRIIPHGLNQVEVAVLDNSGSGEVFLRDLKLKKKDWFFVGIADVTLGVDDTNGPAELVTQDDTHYDSDFFADGRIAFYTKGKTKGGYTVTASADTREAPIEHLFSNFNSKDPQQVFRRLDQDRYYPSYGDDSTSVEDAPTQGKFYAKVQKGESYGMWGNFDLQLTDSDLAQVDRALYGGHLHLESQDQTSFGEDKTRLDVFAAEPGTASAREQYRGTGGSLYFLKHQDITIGSERVRIEIRDDDSDIVLQTRQLSAGQDYDIDPLSGRIILLSPLPSSADDSQLVRAGSLSGNPVYLVVRYEYSPGFEDLDEVAKGGRVSQWFGDHVKLGVTASDVDQVGGNQQLGGVDLTLRAKNGSYIKVDAAKSKGPGVGELRSEDGGFTFEQQDQDFSADAEADAVRVETGIRFGRGGNLNVYGQRREAGFSSPGQLTANEIDQAGFQLRTPIGKHLDLNAKYDDKDEENRLRTSAVDLDLTARLNKNWSATVAGRQDEREDNSAIISPTQTQGMRTDVAVEVAYNSQEAWDAYVFVQDTVKRDGTRESNDRVGAGVGYRIHERLKVDVEASDGDLGNEAKVGLDFLWSDRTNLYLAYALENDRTDTGIRARKGSLTTGFRTRFSDALSVYGEERYTNGDVPTGLTHAYGVELAPTDHWTLGASIEAGTLTDNRTNAETDRNAYHFSAGFVNDVIKFASIMEYREDKSDTEDRETWLTKNTLDYQTNDDWRLLAKLAHSESNSSRGEFFDGDFTEAVLGYAYRPVEDDRWNSLVKLTYFYNMPAAEQVVGTNTSNTILQKSYIFSGDVDYDITRRWTIGGKYAYRRGEVSLDRVNPDYFESDAHLFIIRGEYHVVRYWDFLVEARLLQLPDAEDERSGFLVALYRHFGNHLKLGVGYNFTDFSDDLTDLDYDSQGVFVNIIGKM